MAQVIDITPRIAERDRRRERVAMQRTRALLPHTWHERAMASLRRLIASESQREGAKLIRLVDEHIRCCAFGAEMGFCPEHGRRG